MCPDLWFLTFGPTWRNWGKRVCCDWSWFCHRCNRQDSNTHTKMLTLALSNAKRVIEHNNVFVEKCKISAGTDISQTWIMTCKWYYVVRDAHEHKCEHHDVEDIVARNTWRGHDSLLMIRGDRHCHQQFNGEFAPRVSGSPWKMCNKPRDKLEKWACGAFSSSATEFTMRSISHTLWRVCQHRPKRARAGLQSDLTHRCWEEQRETDWGRERESERTCRDNTEEDAKKEKIRGDGGTKT